MTGTMVQASVIQARRVTLIVMILNAAVAAAKLVVGHGISSVSLVADGYHSLTDALSNVIGLIGLTVSAEPPDEGHPYGHRKFETLASLLAAFLILLTALEVLKTVGGRVGADLSPKTSVAGFATVVVTFVLNLAVATWENRMGKRLGSDFLIVDSHHTFSDSLVTAGVFASLVASSMGYPGVDLVIAAFVGLFIAYLGLRLLAAPIQVLADAEAVPADQVADLVRSVPGVAGCHKVRSRGRPDQFFMELHVQVDADLSVREGHRISHVVKARLMERWPALQDAVIHVEPDRK
jgi:cation diffusion facilitator family transporter